MGRKCAEATAGGHSQPHVRVAVRTRRCRSRARYPAADRWEWIPSPDRPRPGRLAPVPGARSARPGGGAPRAGPAAAAPRAEPVARTDARRLATRELPHPAVSHRGIGPAERHGGPLRGRTTARRPPRGRRRVGRPFAGPSRAGAAHCGGDDRAAPGRPGGRGGARLRPLPALACRQPRHRPGSRAAAPQYRPAPRGWRRARPACSDTTAADSPRAVHGPGDDGATARRSVRLRRPGRPHTPGSGPADRAGGQYRYRGRHARRTAGRREDCSGRPPRSPAAAGLSGRPAVRRPPRLFGRAAPGRRRGAVPVPPRARPAAGPDPAGPDREERPVPLDPGRSAGAAGARQRGAPGPDPTGAAGRRRMRAHRHQPGPTARPDRGGRRAAGAGRHAARRRGAASARVGARPGTDGRRAGGGGRAGSDVWPVAPRPAYRRRLPDGPPGADHRVLHRPRPVRRSAGGAEGPGRRVGRRRAGHRAVVPQAGTESGPAVPAALPGARTRPGPVHGGEPGRCPARDGPGDARPAGYPEPDRGGRSGPLPTARPDP